MNFKNKEDVRLVVNEFKKDLKDLEEKYGIRLDVGRVNYNMDEISMKVRFVNNEGAMEAEEGFKCSKKEFDEFFKYRRDYLVGKLGEIKEHQGKKFQIIGFNSKARKNYLVLKCLDDKKEYVTDGSFFK